MLINKITQGHKMNTSAIFIIIVIIALIVYFFNKGNSKKPNDDKKLRSDIINNEFVKKEKSKIIKEKKKKTNLKEAVVTILKDEYPIDTPEEIIEAFERSDYDLMRRILQQIAYGMVDDRHTEQEKKQFKLIMTYFASRDPLVEDIMALLYPVIKDNEGILQSKIYPFAPEYDAETIRYVLYFAYELGDIVRVKKGRSYQLFSSVEMQKTITM